MNEQRGYQQPGIAGSGAIATGLAAIASATGNVVMLARSEESAQRAVDAVAAAAGKAEGADSGRVAVTTDAGELRGCDVVVEAIAEVADAKVELLASVGEAAPNADLATTTSSLSVTELGERSGHPDRLFGLHPFNPVARMKLVELCFPEALRDGTAERAGAWCERLGKHPVSVPDQTGFVVNRLLFPYLFDAVRLMERTGMSAEEVDECMTLGAGHPMGPLRLLDFVGLDVANAIGEAIHADTGDAAHKPPSPLVNLISEGRLGRKAGAGFYSY